MMKRTMIGLMLAAAMAFSPAACGAKETPDAAPEQSAEQTYESGEAKSAVPSENDDGNAPSAYTPDELVGTWEEPGTFGGKNNTLTVREDGSFTLAYAAGGARFGTVGILAEEHPDGSRSDWYAFYESDGTLWECFAAPQEKPFDDIYSGQDGAMHFVRVNAEAGNADAAAF